MNRSVVLCALAAITLAAADAYGQQMIGSCPVLPADNIWNTPVDTLPVIRDADMVARFSGRTATVTLGRGTVELPSGRRIAVSNGTLEVPDTAGKSPPARVKIRAEGPVEAAIELAGIIVKQCEQLHRALTKLSRFKGIQEHWIEVHRLENEGDRIGRTVVATHHLLSQGALPAKKVAGRWVASRQRLLNHLVGEAA